MCLYIYMYVFMYVSSALFSQTTVFFGNKIKKYKHTKSQT